MQDIWTIQKILRWTQEYFNRHQVPEARLSAEQLLAHILKIKRLELYLQFERILTPDELNQYRDFIQRRIKFEPIQYITGQQDFMGLTFKVTRDTLIPRPETELLVESALEELKKSSVKNPRILDVGTGCGAIAISIAHFHKVCQVMAIDTNEKTLQVARENAEMIGTPNVEFMLADGKLINLSENEKYHLIISNPPYISEKDYLELHPQVKDFEPRQALLAGPEGTEFYKNFIPSLLNILHPKGITLVEIGYDQLKKVKGFFTQYGFNHVQFIQDYHKIPRIVRAER